MSEVIEGPRYRQIARALKAEIEESFQAGDSIETEQALEQRFGVSRITIRHAIDELVREGLLVRRQGSGTFVAQPKVTQELGILRSWTESMRELGLEPRTVDCEILQVVPPIWVAQDLQIDPSSENVLRIQRLRYANEEALALMVDYLRMRFVPDLMEKGLDGESLYETLEKRYGLELARVKDRVTARSASVLEARLLGIEPNAPVLCVRRITYLPNEEPLLAASVVVRADRYEYRVSGLAHNRSDKPLVQRQRRTEIHS
jgi:GntR family transcriptional regulator